MIPFQLGSKGQSSWMPQRGGRRTVLRYCIPPVLLLVIFTIWLSNRQRYWWGKIEPYHFKNCPQAIANAGVPPSEEIGVPEHEGDHWARVISPSDLMAMLDGGQALTNRILHQSWKDHQLPDHFERWSKEWQRRLDQSWFYVLWTDEDNRKLVESYYYEYLEAYDRLPREIYRADMVRNMYMHHFGGVYADLDLVPLRAFPADLPILNVSHQNQTSYLGHMGGVFHEHSIPNAFMASTAPNHPFWLRPLQFVRENMKYDSDPEHLTGPVALQTCFFQWSKERKSRIQSTGVPADVIVLPSETIYPFSWFDAPLVHHCLCQKPSPYFSEQRCQWLFPKAWTVTYWAHSWGIE